MCGGKAVAVISNILRWVIGKSMVLRCSYVNGAWSIQALIETIVCASERPLYVT